MSMSLKVRCLAAADAGGGTLVCTWCFEFNSSNVTRIELMQAAHVDSSRKYSIFGGTLAVYVWLQLVQVVFEIRDKSVDLLVLIC
jgi:hypothetical protein